jgi:hypothetical protein
MIIENKEMITKKEGYDAMLYFLLNYWKLTDSTDLTDILSGGEYIEKGVPADSAFWDYWLEAINEVKLKGEFPIKVLTDK